MQKLQKIRELDGHVTSGGSYLELFHRLADLALKKLDPSVKVQKTSLTIKQPRSPAEPKATPPAEPKSERALRYVSAALKREVWRRDQAQCSYRSKDGKKCFSRFALEIDHIKPVALGGKSEASNLRLLCRAHNRQQAIQMLSPQTMLPFLKC
jgi:hypothetical protein